MNTNTQALREALDAAHDEAEFEVWQDGVMCAGSYGPREDAIREIQHYAAQYAQDGHVVVYEIRRTRLDTAMLSASPAAPEAAKPEPVGINGLTYDETSATASVIGLTRKPEQQAQAGGPCRNDVMHISLLAHNKAIAKKDAALKACVELMQYMRSVASFERNDEIDAAITQAQEALK